MDNRLIDFDDIKSVFKLFLKRWYVIVILVAMTTSLGIYKVSKLQPTYSATSKIFIGKGENLLEFYSQQELDYYSQFLTIFKELSQIDGFLDNALRSKHINKTSSQVAAGLSFSGAASTPIFTISYSSVNPEDMAETLDAVCEELVSKVSEIMPQTVPSVLSKASVVTMYPNKTKLPIIMAMGGVVLAIGIILVWDYLDTRVVTKKELEKLLPIPVIADIPVHEKAFGKEIKDVRNKQNTKVPFGRSL